MREWAITVITAAFISGLSFLILPRGEKSPLYPPLKLLSALILILLLCFPLQKLASDPISFADPELFKADETLSYDPESALLTRSMETIEQKVREKFPAGSYQLRFDTDDGTLTILAIRVETTDKELGKRIEAWLIENGIAS